MRARVSAAASALSTCATYEIFLHRVRSNRTQDRRVFLDLFVIEHSSTDAHAIRASRFLQSQLFRAFLLINCAPGCPAVKLAQVRVINSDESARNGPESNSQIVPVYIAEIIEIRRPSARKSELNQSGRRLAGNPFAFDPEIIQRCPTVASLAYKLIVDPSASRSGPEPDCHCIGVHHESLCGAWGHLPACSSQEGHSESADPDLLGALILEYEPSIRLIFEFFFDGLLLGLPAFSKDRPKEHQQKKASFHLHKTIIQYLSLQTQYIHLINNINITHPSILLLRLHNRINPNILIQMNMHPYIIIFEFLQYNLIKNLFQSYYPLTFIPFVDDYCEIVLARFEGVHCIEQGFGLGDVDWFVEDLGCGEGFWVLEIEFDEVFGFYVPDYVLFCGVVHWDLRIVLIDHGINQRLINLRANFDHKNPIDRYHNFPKMQIPQIETILQHLNLLRPIPILLLIMQQQQTLNLIMREYKLAFIMIDELIEDPDDRLHEGVEDALEEFYEGREVVADCLVVLACAVGLGEHLAEDYDGCG